MWWIAVAAIWTLLALMSASQTAMFLVYRGHEVQWGPLLVRVLADWYTCAIFIPGFVWLARRWPLDVEGLWRRHLPIHIGASLVAVILKYAIYLPVLRWVAPGEGRSYPALLAGNALTELIIFWAIIAVIFAVEFYRRSRDREALALQLSGRLTLAQLDALRGQLRPHFLFNTLNAIATLIHRDVNAADAMIARLAALLRASLQHEATHEVPLDVELSLARDYVGIMEARYGPRVSVSWRIGEGLGDALVPAFVLQPLIENAFEHGVARASGAATVSIVVAPEDGSLVLRVRDSGPGVSDAADQESVGLGNTRRRLEQLYGPRHSLRLASAPGRGTEAIVTLPLHREPAAVPPPELVHA
jgi:two-component system, LytTR family, sensor kinase